MTMLALVVLAMAGVRRLLQLLLSDYRSGGDGFAEPV
jgi:hypothetical protein